MEPWFLFSSHSFSHSTKFIYCLLFVAVNLCPWHGNLKIKMGHSLFFCSRFPGRFARFEFNIITFSFNCTADVLQRDFTIVFEGWPTEKNKKYSEGKKVIKIAKDTKRQHNIKIPYNYTLFTWNILAKHRFKSYKSLQLSSLWKEFKRKIFR